MAAVQPGALAPGPDVTNKQSRNFRQMTQKIGLKINVFCITPYMPRSFFPSLFNYYNNALVIIPKFAEQSIRDDQYCFSDHC
jgi:hypothetical protein